MRSRREMPIAAVGRRAMPIPYGGARCFRAPRRARSAPHRSIHLALPDSAPRRARVRGRRATRSARAVSIRDDPGRLEAETQFAVPHADAVEKGDRPACIGERPPAVGAVHRQQPSAVVSRKERISRLSLRIVPSSSCRVGTLPPGLNRRSPEFGSRSVTSSSGTRRSSPVSRNTTQTMRA